MLFSGIVPSAVIYGMVLLLNNTVRYDKVLLEQLLWHSDKLWTGPFCFFKSVDLFVPNTGKSWHLP